MRTLDFGDVMLGVATRLGCYVHVQRMVLMPVFDENRDGVLSANTILSTIGNARTGITSDWFDRDVREWVHEWNNNIVPDEHELFMDDIRSRDGYVRSVHFNIKTPRFQNDDNPYNRGELEE